MKALTAVAESTVEEMMQKTGHLFDENESYCDDVDPVDVRPNGDGLTGITAVCFRCNRSLAFVRKDGRTHFIAISLDREIQLLESRTVHYTRLIDRVCVS